MYIALGLVGLPILFFLFRNEINWFEGGLGGSANRFIWITGGIIAGIGRMLMIPHGFVVGWLFFVVGGLMVVYGLYVDFNKRNFR